MWFLLELSAVDSQLFLLHELQKHLGAPWAAAARWDFADFSSDNITRHHHSSEILPLIAAPVWVFTSLFLTLHHPVWQSQSFAAALRAQKHIAVRFPFIHSKVMCQSLYSLPQNIFWWFVCTNDPQLLPDSKLSSSLQIFKVPRCYLKVSWPFLWSVKVITHQKKEITWRSLNKSQTLELRARQNLPHV